MACPKVSLRGKTIILLSGYRRVPGKGVDADKKNPEIEALKELQISAMRHPEAVAFGYVSGKWLPAA